MKNSFIKTGFENALNSSATNIDEAKSVFKNAIETDKVSEGVLFNLINRKEYLKDICEVLHSPKQNIIFINGFLGTGKTEFINTIAAALEDNALYFYHECSAITHLDDIILSLFNFLKKMSAGSPEHLRTFKVSNTQSIDERLMNFIRNLNKPLLIIIDGFENLSDDKQYCETEINEEGSQREDQKELINFIEFISSLPQIKIILSGQKFCVSKFFNNSEKIFETRLGALDAVESQKILKHNSIEETESCYNQIYHITRGYPENLLRFSNVQNSSKLASYTLMEEYSEQNKSFEEFMYKKSFSLIPVEFHKLICFFCSIRHSVQIDTLEKLAFTPDIADKTEFLHSEMILTKNRNGFYIKKLLKETISKIIADEEIKQTHRYLYELYSEQIAKKLEERIFPVSRKLLYSEQYYHYTKLLSFGDKTLPDVKKQLKPDFQYLYMNVADTLFVGEENDLRNKTAEVAEVLELQDNMQATHTEEAKINEFELDSIYDFNIELSDEEKSILTEENQQIFPETKKPEEQKSPNGLNFKAESIKNEGCLLFEQGKFDEAIKKFDESIILYEILRDKYQVNKILSSIANAYYECFRHDVALMYFHKILTADSTEIDVDLKIDANCSIADIYNYRENNETAFKFYEKALIEAEKNNNLKQIAKICFKKGLVYDDINNTEKALEFYFKNTEISQDTEINPNIAAAFSNIAAIYEEMDKLEQSIKYHLESLNYDNIMDNYEGQYETLSNIGNIYFELGEYILSNKYFHKSLEIAKKSGDPYKIAMSCLDIGDIYLQQTNYEKAIKAFITAGKTIDKTISTDSREKIDRRFKRVINEIGEKNFKDIMEKLRKKHD